MLDALHSIDIIKVIDILIVAFVLYKLIMLIKGTRAVQLIKGLAVLLIASNLSRYLHLYTIHWMLQNAWTVLFVALPVVFQPELRRALEQLGRGKFFARPLSSLGEEARNRMIGEVVRGVEALARDRVGTLLVIERETGLNDYVETGIKIDGVVSSEFLINLFIPKSPLHDGAAIIRGDRVLAAGCFLPLSENPHLSKQLGTRHRAAVGITEQSDALAVVVSEETGTISLAEEGRLIRYLDEKTLREWLAKCLQGPAAMNFKTWRSAT